MQGFKLGVGELNPAGSVVGEFLHEFKISVVHIIAHYAVFKIVKVCTPVKLSLVALLLSF